MNKECIRCGKEYDGSQLQKYCSDMCRELAGVEKRLDVDLGDTGEERKCEIQCPFRRAYIKKRKTGWYLALGGNAFGPRLDIKVNYCPGCGGRIEGG